MREIKLDHSEFDCANPECGKRVLVPWGADTEEYGYWYRTMRCCSYSCMRKLEKKFKSPFEADDKKKLNSIKKRNENFTKLAKFVALMELGANPDDAAIESGFGKLRTAVNYRYKYYNTPIWKEWMEWKEKQAG